MFPPPSLICVLVSLVSCFTGLYASVEELVSSRKLMLIMCVVEEHLSLYTERDGHILTQTECCLFTLSKPTV